MTYLEIQIEHKQNRREWIFYSLYFYNEVALYFFQK